MRIQAFLIFASAFSFFACNKDSETSEVVDKCQLKTINFSDNADAFFYVKTESGNVVELTSANEVQTKYVYKFDSANKLVKREYFTNVDNLGADLVRGRAEYYYDLSKTLIAIKGYNQMYSAGVALGLNFSGVDSFQYTNGFVSQINSYVPHNGTYIYQGKTLFTWKDGDLSSMLQYGHNGQMSHSIYFTYDVSKENRYDSLFKGFYIQGLFEYGHSLAGLRLSKHVLTSAVEKWNGSSPVTRTYTTTFNKNGFVKSVQESGSGATYYVYRFGFDCD